MDLPAAPLLLTFWQQIQPIDQWLIVHINQNWSSSWLDAILPFFREPLFWAPMYLFLIVFVGMNNPKKWIWWALALVLCAAISDIISSQVIKQLVMRVRPCQDPDVSILLRFFIKYCPQSSSFTSSHATSYFAQACFLHQTLKFYSKWTPLFFIWSGSVAYTQVYVGVHYPFDVLCGGLLGYFIGLFISKLFDKQVGSLRLVA